MSDESKTEQPTEKRLREARARGQFARSPELGIAAVLAAAGTVFLLTARGQVERVFGIATGIFGHLGRYEIKPEEIAGRWTAVAAGTMLALALPMMVVCMLAGTLTAGLQSGFRLSGEALEPKLERLDPAAGLRRIFSPQGTVKFALDVLKFTLVGLILWGGVRRILDDPIFYTPVEVARLGLFLRDVAGSLLLRSALAVGAVAGVNYLYQWRKTHRDLMMTRQEIKEERHAAEGDPLIRSLRRQMARRLMQRQMLSAVPTADVIVTNPTHYAVALRYQRGADRAPVVLARGQNLFAQRIKALAAEHGVPTVENKPVARALYKHGQVGKPIPTELYQAVAEILAFVYKTHRLYFHELRSRRLAEGIGASRNQK